MAVFPAGHLIGAAEGHGAGHEAVYQGGEVELEECVEETAVEVRDRE